MVSAVGAPFQVVEAGVQAAFLGGYSAAVLAEGALVTVVLPAGSVALGACRLRAGNT